MPVQLFGRDEDRDKLRELLDHARAGRGGVVAVTGEIGIGKSTLVDAVADEAAASGATVTRGRAWEAGDAPAYFPLWPCLRAIGVGLADAPGGVLEGRADEFRRWEEVLVTLVARAGDGLVVWVVEDLHAADAQTLDLLAFLAQPLRSTSVLVICTMRSADPRLDEPKLRRLARLLRDANEIRLAALGRRDVAALLRNLVREVPDAVVDELATRTAGNPLFLVECARSLDAAAKNEWRSIALPATVRASVRERLDQLPRATREAVHAAAILGDEAFSGVLARMMVTLPATIIDALDPAVRAGILVELAPGSFRFVHALVRDAIVDAQPAEERARAHGRAAEAFGTVGSPQAIVERAHHALSALPFVEPAALRTIVDDAVRLLTQQGTHDRAQHLFARWLDACARAELPAASVADRIAGAWLAHAAGSYVEARTLCLDAIALARATEDVSGLAHAALALGADLKPGLVDIVLVRALEDALAATDHPMLRCRLGARLAAALQPAPDPLVPVVMAREAIATARELDDDELRRDVLLVAGSAMTDFAPREETRDLAVELLELARAHGDVSSTLRAYARLVVDTISLGDLFAFDAHLDAMLVVARSVGHPRLVWRALLLDSMRALACGRFDESERIVTQVERLAALTDDPALALSLMVHTRLTRPLSLYQEAHAKAAIPMATAMAELPDPTLIRLHLATLHAVIFRDRQAAASLLADHRARLDAMPEAFGAGLTAGLYALAGTPEECRELASALADRQHRHIVEGHVPMAYTGPMRWVLANLHARAGQVAQAETCWREMITTARMHGHRPTVARAELELGEHLLARGEDEGVHLLRAAIVDADALGLSWIADAARRSSTGADAPPARSATPSRPRTFAMRKESAFWRVTFGDRTVHVGDARGLELLSRLVQQSGEDIHVLVLAGDGPARLPESDAGDLLDARAIASYRARVEQLQAQLDDAADRADARRVAALQREREMLEQELARAVGIGGRRRVAASASERARVNVQRRLKDAIARIEQQDAEIGRYLRAAVRTGTYCTFRP